MHINVVLAIDERIDDVKACIASLRAVYGPLVPIALATYGGEDVPKQPAVARYAKAEGFLYYDAPRHLWLTNEDSKEWHACEVLARLQITKHFADLGYKKVYIMHADVRLLGDFRDCYRAGMWGKWSFVAILLRATESFESLCGKGSWGLYFNDNKARLADILTIYNPDFVDALYREYGSDRILWNKYLSRFVLWGDMAQFDVARNWNGFEGRYIPESNDKEPMCEGSVLHLARQTIPGFLSNTICKWIDKVNMAKNYERRALR